MSAASAPAVSPNEVSPNEVRPNEVRPNELVCQHANEAHSLVEVQVLFRRLRELEPARRRDEARAWLRRELAANLGIAVRELEFTRSCGRCGAQHGRPELGGSRAGRASFSFSHTDHYAALALSRSTRVGIDIEMIRPAEFLFEMLSPAERERFRPGPSTDRDLIRLWVRKEALLKVSGLGLSHPPSRLTVDGETRWCNLPADDGRTLRCGLSDVAAPAGAVAAVALHGAIPAVCGIESDARRSCW